MKRFWASGLALGLALTVSGCGSQATSGSGETQVGGNSGNGALTTHQNGRPITGAIFTTDSEGQAVNQNHFEFKEDVYLNGGPRRPGTPALPDGTYYYQITDPGCMELLAGPSGGNGIPDTTGKVITVEDGEFTELIQLAPFNDTPNPGGVYKVWITPTDLYDPAATTGGACFGFLPRFSKMDTFKVRDRRVPPKGHRIIGKKFYDPTLGKAHEADLDGLGGIFFQLWDNGTVIATAFSTGDGTFVFEGLQPGDYRVVEVLPSGGEAVWLPVDGTVRNVSIVDGDVSGVHFRNVCFLPDGDKYLGQPKGPFLDLLFDRLFATNILSHPLIALVAGGNITTPEQLGAFLRLQATTSTQLLAQYVVNLQINLLLGGIDGNAIVLVGNTIADVMTASELLAFIAEAGLVPANLDAETIETALGWIRPVLVLQAEPCTVAYVNY
jgi:hypothetical protein